MNVRQITAEAKNKDTTEKVMCFMYFAWSGIIRSVIMGECFESGRK